MDVVTGLGAGVATNVTKDIVGVLIQQLKDVKELGKNLQLLDTEFARMDRSLRHIQNQFEDQQKKLPELVESCLEGIKNSLVEAEALIHRTNRQRERCLGCCLFCSPKIPAEIREWKIRIGELFKRLDSELSRATDAAQLVQFAPLRADLLLQPTPTIVEAQARIEADQKQLFMWLNDPQARVIGVYGMGGIGKTLRLQFIYNKCQKKVSANFDLVFWFSVSGVYSKESLQNSIAQTLNLKFEENASSDMRKMKLYASLKNKRFLLVLDDLWSPIDLDEVGLRFGDHNQSKILISSRDRDVIGQMSGQMGAKEYSMKIQPLSTEEGWELFKRKAFTTGSVQQQNLEVIGREIASECEGLPLAINTVAAALASKMSVGKWNSALSLMRNADPSFPTTHESIDTKLYQHLRISYLNLPDDNLRMCFLYCAAFPDDKEIDAETLVEMWTAERLVPQTSTTYFMDAGREYIDLLVDRCLFEYVDAEKKKIKTHDVLRDMAIHIGQREKKCLFLSGKHLRHFPSEEETSDRKRISVSYNEISVLPTDLKECPTLVTLLLGRNRKLKKIPNRFWVSFISLKVLDLSHTFIKALPTSVGQLRQLEFLNLDGCIKLTVLPDSICNLSHLQFLNLEDCASLRSIPDRIGQLNNLKHFIFVQYCDVSEFKGIPLQIFQLTSLKKLILPNNNTVMSLEQLTNLSNLIELDVTVKPKITGGSMSTWSEMRNLRLRFDGPIDESRDDAALDILPQNMQSIMKKLQNITLFQYRGVSLPDCICQFQYLKSLCLYCCRELKELPALQNGSDGARAGFPMLEELKLEWLLSLESIVWMEGLPNLRELNISYCPQLKELSMDGDGGFPMLERLGLNNLESIVWNAKTMLRLQIVWLQDCPVLKTFRMEELPNLRKLAITRCSELLRNSLWREGTMLKLESLDIAWCSSSRRFIIEKFPNLKKIKISRCELEVEIGNLPMLEKIKISRCELEVEIGNLPMLENLILSDLQKIETIAGPSSVWNEETMPRLQTIYIWGCPNLRRLPRGLDKLSNLREIVGTSDWWEGISWENDDVKIKLSPLFKENRYPCVTDENPAACSVM